MTVIIKLFAAGREIVGTDSLSIQVPQGATAGAVLSELKARYPKFSELSSLLLAVNADYALPETVLSDGDEVVLIPPVSGG